MVDARQVYSKAARTLGFVALLLAACLPPFAAATQSPPAGADAHKGAAWSSHSRTSLTVLVVGESARAQSLGILGYERDTTPQLKKQDGLIAFSDVLSCGTQTAVSLPCMFSSKARKDFADGPQQGLLDMIHRAGVQVLWWDNQAGCAGACDAATVRDLSHLSEPNLCAAGQCQDEILLQGLQPFIDHLRQDTVLVLHLRGSAGPDYYRRYPKAYEHFTPVCHNQALDQCSHVSLVNAYDNSLVYTDHVLSTLIDLLRANQAQVDTAMLYMSDHGESLGEYNQFLHGAPWPLAPDQQKHVPLLAWFSEGYKRTFSVDTHCLQQERNRPLSQDYLFHSMLGLLQLDTGAYDPQLDLFAGCRAPAMEGAWVSGS
ncbi:transmembrane sulfatase [Pseudomonas sp. M47T1]|nr:transmembrane sulfatase [Pseudomonas sp. M47T1]